jgi:hypothetical protein
MSNSPRQPRKVTEIAGCDFAFDAFPAIPTRCVSEGLRLAFGHFCPQIPRSRFLKLRILVRAGSPAHPLPVA